MKYVIVTTFIIHIYYYIAYDEAIALDGTAVLFRSNKAAVYIEMGQPDTAIEICNEALEVARSVRASYEDKAKV
jgi:tetratricopeptide (TPR) repeat protein